MSFAKGSCAKRAAAKPSFSVPVLVEVEESDPLATMDDTFDGATLDAKWTIVESTGTTVTQSLHDGELDFEISAGGSNGSFWFDSHDGCGIYQSVTGAFDARMRGAVRNVADTGVPASSGYKLAGLQAIDPDMATNFNYLHVMAGTFNSSPSRVEWKTTDDSDSAYATPVAAPDAGLDLDFRIVRRAAALQVFDLYVRDSALQADLLNDDNWVFVETVDRTDNTIPDRDANNGALNQAVSLPNTIYIGPVIYSNNAGHDVRIHVYEFRVRTPA